MLAALEAAAAAGQKTQADALAGQASIFDLGGSGEEEPQRHHPPVVGPELDKKELLSFESCRALPTDHPLPVADQLRRRVDLPLRDLAGRREHETVSVGGLVASLRVTTSRSGDPMAFARLDDGMTQVEVVVFGKVYGACREHLVEDAIVIVKGRVDRRDEGETKLRALEIAPFEGGAASRRGAPARGTRRVVSAGFVSELARLINEFPAGERRHGGRDRGGRACPAPRSAYKVRPASEFFSEVRVLGGEAQLV
jgi:DNA polymerase-3 subunit alpha